VNFRTWRWRARRSDTRLSNFAGANGTVDSAQGLADEFGVSVWIPESWESPEERCEYKWIRHEGQVHSYMSGHRQEQKLTRTLLGFRIETGLRLRAGRPSTSDRAPPVSPSGVRHMDLLDDDSVAKLMQRIDGASYPTFGENQLPEGSARFRIRLAEWILLITYRPPILWDTALTQASALIEVTPRRQ
jgi:hypothetical protein